MITYKRQFVLVFLWAQFLVHAVTLPSEQNHLDVKIVITAAYAVCLYCVHLGWRRST